MLLVVVGLGSGCVEEDNKKDNDINDEIDDEKNTIIQSCILVTQNLTYLSYHTYRDDVDLPLIIDDDEEYISLSGDCMTPGRGIILSNFTCSNQTKMSDVEDCIRIINATLIVEYKTKGYYNSSTFFQWTMDDNYINTSIKPTNVTTDITEKSLIFTNSQTYENFSKLKIKYFNPQGGIAPIPIYIDYVRIEIYYELEK